MAITALTVIQIVIRADDCHDVKHRPGLGWVFDLECADVAARALRSGDAALVSGCAGCSCRVTSLDRWAGHSQFVRGSEAAVILQRAEIGVDSGQVASCVAADITAGCVLDQVVALRGQYP